MAQLLRIKNGSYVAEELKEVNFVVKKDSQPIPATSLMPFGLPKLLETTFIADPRVPKDLDHLKVIELLQERYKAGMQPALENILKEAQTFAREHNAPYFLLQILPHILSEAGEGYKVRAWAQLYVEMKDYQKS